MSVVDRYSLGRQDLITAKLGLKDRIVYLNESMKKKKADKEKLTEELNEAFDLFKRLEEVLNRS